MKTDKSRGKRDKKPWPTKDAMEQVYAMKLWGDIEKDFYSGDGSHLPHIVDPYISALIEFLTTSDKPMVVCDLGCGDFNIGKKLVKYSKKYIAVDIVADLIERNKLKFQAENLEFHCLDITNDELPSGDCVVLRQVLQHLSNPEVHQIINKLSKYKYLVLTEHVPEGDFIPNKEIISGQGIRLKKQSGIDVLAPPFNLKVKEEKQLVSVHLVNNKGVIKTRVYKMF